MTAESFSRDSESAVLIVKTLYAICLMMFSAALLGCGATNSRTATEQLLTSEAVDMAVSQIDFRSLANQKVYFDTQYLHNFKGIGFTNAEYIISSLRQQMVGAGCLLEDDKAEAEYVLEARIGALGSDSHDIVYGLPASSALSTAAAAVSGAPAIPTIPEISLARKNEQSAAAKLAVFAYRRETKERVWQSGMSIAKSTAKDVWILGAGPFQSGTVYDGVQFAGSEIELSLKDHNDPHRPMLSSYKKAVLFNPVPLPTPERMIADEGKTAVSDQGVTPASHAETEMGGGG